MKARAFILATALAAALLLPFASGAQGRWTFPPDTLRAGDARTTGAVTLYVDPTGSDGNACTGSGAAACLTIAGALAKLPSVLCHTVTINVATGNYTGASLERFLPCSDAAGANSGSLNLLGTLVPATLASGSASFTFTSQTVGTSLGNTWGLLNKTLAGWTVNDLRGRALEATALSVARVIASNDATSITIAGPSSASATTGTAWVVEDWGSVITTGATYPGTASTNYAGFILGPLPRGISAFISIQRFRVSTAVPRCIVAAGPAYMSLRLIRCDSGGSSADQLSSSYPVSGSLTDSVIKPNNARYAISFDQADTFTSQRNVFIGTPGFGVRVFSARVWNDYNDFYVSQPLAGATFGMVAQLNILGTHYDTSAGTACLAFGNLNQGFYAAFGYANIDASDFSNCSGSGVYVSGPFVAHLTNATGTGNTRFGLEVNNSARAVVSGNTVTGALGDTAVGPTPTVTAWGSISTGVSDTSDFSRITP